MQLGLYFDQSICTGCQTCTVACKDWHNIEAKGVSWLTVTSKEEGTFPKVAVSFLFRSCVHCVNAPCVAACPSDAIKKRKEDGVVVVDQEACLGKDACGMACKLACPYDSPQFEDKHDAKMQKCDLCLERWAEGKKPICVEACLTRALDAGPLEELSKKYAHTKEASGFAYSQKAAPAIIFTPQTKGAK